MEFKPLKVVLGPPQDKENKANNNLYITSKYDLGDNLLQFLVSKANLRYDGLKDDTRFKLDPPYMDLSKISCKCHEHFNEQNIKALPPDYKLICCARRGSYHGCLYLRGATDEHHTQLIIAHKGTDAKYAGMDGIAMNNDTLCQNAACTFAIWVLDQLNYDPISNELSNYTSPQPPAQIIFTGHSLGGWLAQVSSFSAKYHQITDSGNNLSFTRRFPDSKNGECENWFHPRCIVFDSPGACEIIEKMWNVDNDFMPGGEKPKLDIKNLVRCPNQVNCVNWHFGDIFLRPGKTLNKAKRRADFGQSFSIQRRNVILQFSSKN